MTKIITTILISILFVTYGFSQDSTATAPEPVKDIFGSTMIIDNQTVVTPLKGGKQLVIQHRFSKMDKINDLYGLYGSSNIRLAFTYGITRNIMAGFGTERINKLQELYWKYTFLRQKTQGMPFSVSYFGNVTADGRPQSGYGDSSSYKFIDRLSYFNQIIVSRKFGERFSFEIACSYSHFNKVDSLVRNDTWGWTAGARLKVFREISLIGEYDYAHWVKSKLWYMTDPQPNYAFGIELGTSTHTFQVFASTWDRLNPQQNFNFNQKKFEDLMLGFNITVRL